LTHGLITDGYVLSNQLENLKIPILKIIIIVERKTNKSIRLVLILFYVIIHLESDDALPIS
jgi:hypothetical protein